MLFFSKFTFVLNKLLRQMSILSHFTYRRFKSRMQLKTE